jgi:hypothetical protein
VGRTSQPERMQAVRVPQAYQTPRTKEQIALELHPLQARHPRIVIVHTPTYASWLNQVEIYFSIIQRKVLKPNDYCSLEDLEDALHAFARHYSALGKPFAWCFTRQELERRLRDPNFNLNPACPQPPDPGPVFLETTT